ncbi:hypothetical protein C6A37_02605 [Desulfobacteraceae bacterium SEEP-SAG9]|nr:hypothetical protein C6A37_02605 [Desulfobacteraceae bacterium SEEP-SAG9]
MLFEINRNETCLPFIIIESFLHQWSCFFLILPPAVPFLAIVFQVLNPHESRKGQVFVSWIQAVGIKCLEVV